MYQSNVNIWIQDAQFQKQCMKYQKHFLQYLDINMWQHKYLFSFQIVISWINDII
jgi:hypothetical protein